MLTYCWRAYSAAALAAGVTHRTVNYSVAFVNEEAVWSPALPHQRRRALLYRPRELAGKCWSEKAECVEAILLCPLVLDEQAAGRLEQTCSCGR